MVRVVRGSLLQHGAFWCSKFAVQAAGRTNLLVQEEIEVGLVVIEELPLRSTVLRLPEAWRELPK